MLNLDIKLVICNWQSLKDMKIYVNYYYFKNSTEQLYKIIFENSIITKGLWFDLFAKTDDFKSTSNKFILSIYFNVRVNAVIIAWIVLSRETHKQMNKEEKHKGRWESMQVYRW